jgi:hypothetical protein
MRSAPFLALGLMLLAACASGGGAGGGESQDRYLITSQELIPYATQNVYEAVSRLRRFWIQGSGGFTPRVFVNDVEVGGAPSLDQYRCDMVAEIRYVRPTDAMQQYGPDYQGGVIKVTLR